VVLFVAIGIFVEFFGTTEDATHTYDTISYTTATVARATGTLPTVYSGVLEARSFARITPEVSGVVTEVRVKNGDTVHAGDILVTLAHTDIQAKLATAYASLKSAQAFYGGARSSQETNTMSASLNFLGTEVSKDTYLTQYSQDLAQAYRSAYEGAQQMLTTAIASLSTLATIEQLDPMRGNGYQDWELDMQQKKALTLLIGAKNGGNMSARFIATYTDGVYGALKDISDAGAQQEAFDVAFANLYDGLLYAQNAFEEIKPAVYHPDAVSDAVRTEYDTALTNIEQARSSYRTYQQLIENAKLTLRNTEKEYTVAVQQAHEQKEGAIQNGRYTASAAEAEMYAAQARVQELEILRSKYIIRAPFDGIVTEKNAATGQLASMGTALVSVVDNQSYKVMLQLPPEEYAGLSVGTVVLVTIDGLSDTYTGTILAVSPSLNTTTRKLPVEIMLDTLPTKARSGLYVRVILPAQLPENTFMVPRAYVGYEYDGTYVQEKNARIPVQIVRENDTRVFITGDLTEGASIVLP